MEDCPYRDAVNEPVLTKTEPGSLESIFEWSSICRLCGYTQPNFWFSSVCHACHINLPGCTGEIGYRSFAMDVEATREFQTKSQIVLVLVGLIGSGKVCCAYELLADICEVN